MSEIRVTLPLDEPTAISLRAGDLVRLNGLLYTARDAAHKRLIAALERGETSPIPHVDQVIYYVGPSPAKEGQVIGAAGPTTSGRMDPYTLPLLKLGVRGFIGKGFRSAEIKAALVEHQAVYLAAVGGAAALLARHVVQNRIVAYPGLGPEAIRELIVEEFPVIVVNDCHGGDAYEAGRAQYAA
ncbi:MAG: fumarate hydratase C-terminal domain-containing protein [Chloroflexota bacterium]|nr:MAG: fumarate hydratase C-terminal domain-containing protein [Chloroflexota bacterium]